MFLYKSTYYATGKVFRTYNWFLISIFYKKNSEDVLGDVQQKKTLNTSSGSSISGVVYLWELLHVIHKLLPCIAYKQIRLLYSFAHVCVEFSFQKFFLNVPAMYIKVHKCMFSIISLRNVLSYY